MTLVASGAPNLYFWFPVPWPGFPRGSSPPFGASVTYDSAGREIQTIAIKVTTSLVDGRPLSLGDQVPIQYTDRFADHGRLEAPSDFALSRTGTSVRVGGTIVSASQAGYADVRIGVGKLQVDLRAFGERRWTRHGEAWRPTAPQPFTHLAFAMHEAFGGAGFAENPAGKGHVAAGDDPDGAPLERLGLVGTDERNPWSARQVACADFIAPHWEPRRTMGGTYDADWRRKTAPFPPIDRRPAHGDCVPSLFVHRPFLKGGERVALEGFSTGPIQSRVPRFRFQLLGVGVSVPFTLERLELLPDDQRAVSTFAARLDVSGKLDRLQPLRIISKKIVTELRS